MQNRRIEQALAKTAIIAFPAQGRRVDRTVAQALKETIAPQAEVVAVEQGTSGPPPGSLRVAVADEEFATIY